MFVNVLGGKHAKDIQQTRGVRVKQHRDNVSFLFHADVYMIFRTCVQLSATNVGIMYPKFFIKRLILYIIGN